MDAVESPVRIAPGAAVEINFDLTVLAVEEGIEVTAEAGTPLDVLGTSMLVETMEGELIDLLPVRGENVDALLPLLPGVVHGPNGRLSVKGS